jgi:dephospho-CoA kinase
VGDELTARPLLVGLTGGIGAGKSAVDRAFEALGVPVIDADRLVHEILDSDAAAIADVAAAFGPGVLAAGKIDRSALGRIVFADPEARRRLESLVHPRVTARVRERIAQLSRGVPPPALIVVDAALMVETGTYRDYDRLVVVTAPEELRRARLRDRDGLGDEEAERRIRAQAPDDVKLARADHVLRNDAGLEELQAQVRGLHAQLLAEGRSPRGRDPA